MCDLLTREELADFLSCSLGTIDNLRRSGKIPHVKIGRLIRFPREDVEKALIRNNFNN